MPMTIGSPCWYTIPATSIPRAESFYKAVFNWTFSPPPSDAIEAPLTAADYSCFNFMDCKYSVTGCLIKVDAVEEFKSNPKEYKRVNFFYLVDDVDLYEKKIVEAGGEIVERKHAQGTMGFQSFFKDTEGNVFGIWMHNCRPDCPCKDSPCGEGKAAEKE